MKALFAVGLLVVMPALVGAEEKSPSYVRDIKPILTNYCVRCHKPGKLKAGLNLTSVERMLKPAKKGKVMVVPGKPNESQVVLTMEGKRPAMPPRKSKQPARKDIDLIRAWISAGAKDDTPATD